MSRLLRFLSQCFTIGVLTLVVGGVAGIAMVLVTSQIMPPDSRGWRDLQCAIGIPAQEDQFCIQRQLAEIEEQRRQQRREFEIVQRQQRNRLAEVERERLALEQARRQLEADLADAIKSAPDQELVFVSGGAHGGKTLVAGALYADAASKTGLIRAWCYAITDVGGLDPRVALARMEKDGAVTAIAVSPADLSAYSWSEADVVAARALCPWGALTRVKS